MNKELEEAKEYLEHEVKVYENNKEINQLIGGKIGERQHEINKTLLNYIDNSISKEEYNKIKEELEEYKKQLDLDYVRNNFISKKVVEEKIKELNEDIEDYLKTDKSGRFTRTNCIFTYKKEALQELLEGK